MPDVQSVEVYTTNDMSFSAYLMMHGIQLLSAQKLKRTFKFTFKKCQEIDTLKMKYLGSESSKFDDAVRKLKKLVYGDA